MSQTFYAHYRCRKQLASAVSQERGANSAEFVRLGKHARAGDGNGDHSCSLPDRELCDRLRDVGLETKGLRLPLCVDEIVDHLRLELYIKPHQQRPFNTSGLIYKLYYAVRPLLGTPLRKKLQQWAFRGWKSIRFPAWPLDTSVENTLASVMTRALQAGPNREEPFIWFWPDSASAALMMTHDVETEVGLRFVPRLMDIDDEYRIPASFQLVPEERYAVRDSTRQLMRDRGYEVCIQDLNHDGHLFDNEATFRQRVALINDYARRWGAAGFRAGAMYRNQTWSSALAFEYDMSVPNIGHLEAQRGGCCTVFPYFNGQILELPLTTTQDYSLFNILGLFSTELWMHQINRILEHSGLISFIVHPDYVTSAREQKVYRDLLEIMGQLRNSRAVWVARPAEVNRWWRDRAQSELICEGDSWKIKGPASDRATIAYARVEDGRLVYRLEGFGDFKQA